LAAQASQRSRVAALAGQREVLQESMSERRQQIQVRPPGECVTPSARHRMAAHMLHVDSTVYGVHAARQPLAAVDERPVDREQCFEGVAGTTARVLLTFQAHPVPTLQVYLSSLQAEQKHVRQVLADATMAAQQTQLHRDRLSEKHAVIASTVTPTATADQASMYGSVGAHHAAQQCLWQVFAILHG
jgi:hypothetical protein